MLRTKIAELGKLNLLEDGGLVASVIWDEPPSLNASALKSSLYWASPNLAELAIGDLVEHLEHGVALFLGRSSVCSMADGRETDHLLLEFVDGAKLYVPPGRDDLIRKVGGTGRQLSKLGAKGAKWLQSANWVRSYLIEVLPSAYAWQGIGAFPEFPMGPSLRRRALPGEPASPPEPPSSEEVAKWRRDCASYQKALHADSSYRKAAQGYFERQSREPQPLLDWWVYRTVVLRVETLELAGVHNRDEQLLLIRQYVLRRERKVEKIRREVETLENCERLEGSARETIPESVRLFVWRRDKGQCVQCGARERLEFDHIIPVVAGGSNTERNVQLLCESCNRSKSAKV